RRLAGVAKPPVAGELVEQQPGMRDLHAAREADAVRRGTPFGVELPGKPTVRLKRSAHSLGAPDSRVEIPLLPREQVRFHHATQDVADGVRERTPGVAQAVAVEPTIPLLFAERPIDVAHRGVLPARRRIHPGRLEQPPADVRFVRFLPRPGEGRWEPTPA